MNGACIFRAPSLDQPRPASQDRREKESARTPKQVEKVGVGSAMPSSVPGVFEV